MSEKLGYLILLLSTVAPLQKEPLCFFLLRCRILFLGSAVALGVLLVHCVSFEYTFLLPG